jgi:predicted permease
MSSSSFAPILLNSFKAIASLFLQYVIGAVVAWVGVIKEGDMRAFSAIMNAVLIPLLSVVSLGRGLSPAVFASDGWMLALLGSFSMLEYAALAFALRPLAKPDPQAR